MCPSGPLSISCLSCAGMASTRNRISLSLHSGGQCPLVVHFTVTRFLKNTIVISYRAVTLQFEYSRFVSVDLWQTNTISDNVWWVDEMSDNVWPDRAGNFHPVRSGSDKFADECSFCFHGDMSCPPVLLCSAFCLDGGATV